MNRQQRRAEARRHKQAGTAPPRITVAVVDNAMKTLIAQIVRSVTAFDAETVSMLGGACLFRAVAGLQALHALGWLNAGLTIGGVLFRAGPHPVRDTIGYAGLDGPGTIDDDGVLIGHVWLTFDDAFIDFSAGDWRADHIHSQSTGKEVFSYPEPTEWQCDPPDFIWAPKSELAPTNAMIVEAAQTLGTIAPPLGQVWYTPFNAELAAQEVYLQRAIARATSDPLFRPAAEHIVQQIFQHFGADGLLLAQAMRAKG